jgi:cytidylate kinase
MERPVRLSVHSTWHFDAVPQRKASLTLVPARAVGMMGPMIVTIARQRGAQGETVGRAVADALGWAYVDREIITQAAIRARVSEATIEQAERVPSLLTRMMEALGRYPSGFEMAEALPGVPHVPPLSSDAYRTFIEQVIHQLEETTDAVIIGHAAQAVLRGSGQVIHVFVVAPLDQRARLVAAQEGIAPDDAIRQVKATDTERADYHQRYYNLRWNSLTVYDLVLNTGRLPVSAAAELIVDLVRARLDEA